jgi:hypothetical protein
MFATISSLPKATPLRESLLAAENLVSEIKTLATSVKIFFGTIPNATPNQTCRHLLRTPVTCHAFWGHSRTTPFRLGNPG